MKKYIYIALLALLAFGSCGEVEDPLVTELKHFLKEQKTVGVFQNGKPLFAFSEDMHQLCTNATAQMCRIQLDDALRALEMKLSAAPEVGKTLTLTVRLHNLELPLKSTYEVEVSEVDATQHLVRLFERETLLGFVFYYE